MPQHTDENKTIFMVNVCKYPTFLNNLASMILIAVEEINTTLFALTANSVYD